MSLLLSAIALEDTMPVTILDTDRFEILDGSVVEKPMGAKSDSIALTLGSLLRDFVRTHQLGRVFGSQTGYRCFPHAPQQLRRPDASFMSRDRLPEGQVPDGDFLIAPDLAVEVVSPNDLYESIEQRINDYLRAGVRLIWVVSPGSQTVVIRRLDGTCAVANLEGQLIGDDVVPGFHCRVAEVFE